MKVRFHTNLDLVQWEQFPTELNYRPMVGDFVRSARKHDFHAEKQIKLNPPIQLILEVYSVTILEDGTIEAELHLPKRLYGKYKDDGTFDNSLSNFYKNFYEPLTGKWFI